jgi:8-oxo-dGTP pyrophosphatase MutT (NUDIX family)
VKQEREELPQIIRERLNSRNPKLIDADGRQYRHAGVLIPLFLDNGEYKILFTKRTQLVEHHKGQISFPGGAVDEDDKSPKDTALREACEEVGLKKKDVYVLGRIDDTMTVVSDFVVHAFVGLVPYPYEFKINTIEVERLIKVPLNLFHPKNSRARRYVAEYDGSTYHGIAFEYEGDIIWGATARMMDRFMEIISPKLPLLHEP